ncbi:cilia- and flagella-associated protein 52-like [Procambarus clarkii]|uniref:cilia- and flagella-associated protein 52-like n=1 Tax=Procambarus clarkii TaxID=6728 RepID=UPI0037435F97
MVVVMALFALVASWAAVLVSVMAPRPTPTSGAPTFSRASTPGIQTLLVLPGGDLLVGDLGGALRAYRQVPDERAGGRPGCSGPPRAHGSVKYTHPKDPTRPLLAQVWCAEVGAGVTSVSMVGREVVVGTVNSEIFTLQLPLPSTTPVKPRASRTSANPHPSKTAISIPSPKSTAAKPTAARFMPENRTNGATKNTNAITKGRRVTEESQSSQQIDARSNRPLSQSSPKVEELARLGSGRPEVTLLSTCHSEPIYDLTFPRGVGELVVCGGVGGVRVWNVRSLQEVLRVELPGLVCCCCSVTPALDVIVTGWSDGRLRGLGAESGRVVWVVDDAHHAGVNSVAALSSGHLVSGGRDGRVRVWLAEGSGMRMTASQKEHRGEVTYLALAPSETRVLSCSGDGSCILWRLPELARIYRLTAHTVFLGGSLLSSGEIVTVGSDGSILVWENQDGALLADLPASSTPVTTVASTVDDAILVTAGEDAVIKVWDWKKGRVTHEGRGHSGAITRVCLSPAGNILASVGRDGALLLWKLPQPKT